MVLYSKFTYGSQFSEEKNGLEIRFLGPEILSKYKRSIFFGTPCILTFSPNKGYNCMGRVPWMWLVADGLCWAGVVL